jgi:archaellum component FlaC
MAQSKKKDQVSKDLSAVVKKLEVKLQDMDSRVTEIENFRNHPSIEGKINSIYTDIESINESINKLKAQVKGLMQPEI